MFDLTDLKSMKSMKSMKRFNCDPPSEENRMQMKLPWRQDKVNQESHQAIETPEDQLSWRNWELI